MGGNISKDSPSNNGQHHRYGGYPPSPNQFQPGFTQQGAYTPPHPHSPSPYGYPSAPSPQNNAQPSRRLQRKYSKIPDNYRTLDEVTAALAQAGLESSNLIVGIDFTKSNEWTGAKSFNKKCLHHIGDKSNPYEQAISIIGKTLSKFDEDNLIPCYGFGDASTHDQDVFSFCDDNRYCQGFEEVLSRYREIAPQIQLSGPTSFAPIIEMAMTIVEQSGGQYHVLLIIADGQVTRSVDTIPGHLSPQEQNSLEAIVQASGYPLSIVLVGVGDGPWDMMKEFDDNVPSSAFDNFQFVNFTEIMSKKADISRKQTEFALSALMEIPFQYKATLEHGLLGRRTGRCQVKVPLPPPHCNKFASPSRSRSYSQSSSFLHSTSTRDKGSDSRTSNFLHSTSTRDKGSGTSSATPTTSMSIPAYDSQLCPVCIFNPRDMVFGCGHQACSDCGGFLDACPICLRPIEVRIRLC
ncbi:E3 ubiquitin-protein ligase RGLG5-like [Silene latifolia]|uniref:E3 ubiquitin-protein ligase RGLG5-like n=1 Tax=Silene latifolia TaxID=37657 RepID=UPI003D771DD6